MGPTVQQRKMLDVLKSHVQPGDLFRNTLNTSYQPQLVAKQWRNCVGGLLSSDEPRF
jgi:hypothetical protein